VDLVRPPLSWEEFFFGIDWSKRPPETGRSRTTTSGTTSSMTRGDTFTSTSSSSLEASPPSLAVPFVPFGLAAKLPDGEHEHKS
jgi:hypothetical protein